MFAGVAELADAPDLGSGGIPMQVQVLSPAPNGANLNRCSVYFFEGLLMAAVTFANSEKAGG